MNNNNNITIIIRIIMYILSPCCCLHNHDGNQNHVYNDRNYDIISQRTDLPSEELLSKI